MEKQRNLGQILAGGELLLAAALWGFGFVASLWVLKVLTPFSLTFLRFALASVLVLPILAKREWRHVFLQYLPLALWPGVFFAFCLLIQTWGLEYTTATKSSFLTTLYVVFVPCLEAYLGRHKLPLGLILCVAASFLGTAMIVNVGLNNINKGDLLTVGCAILCTGQIHVIGLVSPKVRHPLLFNAAQTLWAALVCLPFGLTRDLGHALLGFAEWPRTAQWGLLSLVLGSTIVAFTLQVRAQAYLRPTVSSLLFLLESPFAMLFAFLLAERLGPLEVMGAVVIFMAAAAASFLDPSPAKKD